MNKFDFTRPGGFPLDQEVLRFMQDCTALASAPAWFGGEYCIVSGCVDNGTTVTDGIISISGELLPFVGGAKQAKVIVVEKTENLVFEDGAAKPVQFSRSASFGDDGITNILWSSFKRNKSGGVLSRLDALEEMVARLETLERVSAPFLQYGAVVIWIRPANQIPPGWAEVLDLRGRMPVGFHPGDVDFNQQGKPGGGKSHTLTGANLPEHYHNTVVADHVDTTWFPDRAGRLVSSDRSMIRSWNKGDGSGKESYQLYGAVNTFPYQQPNAGPTSKAGNPFPDSVNHLNPYRVVYFIEYVGV
jgi:microcystin-dependent protein